MKTPKSQEDLEILIEQGVEERLDLEYKAASALERSDESRKEISKDVSAFANSDGGTLIYGISEFRDKLKAHLPERLDPIDGKKISREWLDQIIGNIRPRLEVAITPVRLNSGENDCAYVIEIPKGKTAHQASDLKYYKRFNFRCEAMHDYEIRDIMSRGNSAILHPEFLVTTRIRSLKDALNRQREYTEDIFTVDISNTSGCFANHALLWINVPNNMLYHWPENADGCTRVLTGDSGTTSIRISNRLAVDHSRSQFEKPRMDYYFSPIFPFQLTGIASFYLKREIFKDARTNEFSIKWAIQSEKSDLIRGESPLKEIPITRV